MTRRRHPQDHRRRRDLEADRGQGSRRGNLDLEGVGFIDERTGWAGGWGQGFPRHPTGTTSGTTDGGATWSDANDVGHFINRFRFFPGATSGIVGYCLGRHHLSMHGGDRAPSLPRHGCRSPRVGVPAIPLAWDKLDIEVRAGRRQAIDRHRLRSPARRWSRPSPRRRRRPAIGPSAGISRPTTARTPASASSSTGFPSTAP